MDTKTLNLFKSINKVNVDLAAAQGRMNRRIFLLEIGFLLAILVATIRHF